MCERRIVSHEFYLWQRSDWAQNLQNDELYLIKCGMKVAKVAPIHKDGDKNNFNNYRSISISLNLTRFLNAYSPIISWTLLGNLTSLPKGNSEFWKKHCTEHAILDLKEYILKRLDEKEVMAVLFLDLQNAFDTVSHDILLRNYTTMECVESHIA